MMRVARRLTAAIGMLGLTFTLGCPGFFVYPGSQTGSGSSTGNYVYVANSTSNSVGAFSIGTSTLGTLANSPYGLTFSPVAMAINPADSLLYVAGGGQISAYAISSTNGTLSALYSGAAVAIVNVAAMDISPDGQWLLVLDSNGITIDEFQINSTSGALTQELSTAYTVSSGTVVPRAIKFAPNGALVFVALGTGGDLVYSFNTASTSGALTNGQSFATLTAPVSDNALAVNPAGTAVYVARSNGTLPGTIAAYNLVNGGITLSPVALGTTGAQPSAVAVNAAGTDVYVANKNDSTVSGFSTTASAGVLPALGGSPYTSGTTVNSVVADKSGTYLLAAALGGSPDLTMYSFDATTTGALDRATTISTGSQPAGAIAVVATH